MTARGGYASVHRRVRAERGPARTHNCSRCGGVANHWAYDHGDPQALVDDAGQVYSNNTRHYIPLCAECHRLLDSSPEWAAIKATLGVAPKPLGRPVTTGTKPVRTTRQGEEWDQAAAIAAARGETMTAVVKNILTSYVRRHRQPPPPSDV